MLLLSPMSSKPHFCTLVLPGFCLARLAVDRSYLAAGVAVAVAAAAALLSNKDLLGAGLYTIMLWHGTVMWDATALLAGCLFVLARGASAGAAGTAPAPPVVARAA